MTCLYFARACSKASGLASTPTTRCRRLRQHRGAVALAAREVDDLAAVHALGDPLVDHEVALVPVVLLGDVGQRALARQVQGRDAGGLVALDVELGHAEARINTETHVRKGRQASLTVSTGWP